MNMEARCLSQAETLMAQKPNWLNFLPEDPSQMIMTYIPFSEKTDGHYSIKLTKPVKIEGEIEVTENLIVSEQEIESAKDWLTSMYSKFIDQHDDEGRALRLSDGKNIVKAVDTINSNPIFVFGKQKVKEQAEKIKHQEGRRGDHWGMGS